MGRSDHIKQVFHENAQSYLEKFTDQSKYIALWQEFALALIQPSPSILDLGCGPGNVIKLIKELIPNSKITGIDFAHGMIDLAKKMAPDATYHVCDIRKTSTLCLPHFDGIICSFCLPYLSPSDAKTLLKQLATLTHLNSMVYLSTMEWSPKNSGYVKSSNNEGPGIFTYYYDRDFLLSLLHECGFKVYKTTQIDQVELGQNGPNDLVILAKKLT